MTSAFNNISIRAIKHGFYVKRSGVILSPKMTVDRTVIHIALFALGIKR